LRGLPQPAHHVFELPENAVDKQMASGHISPELPFIKKKAVELLKVNYPTRDVARQNIAADLNNFYRTNYPQIYQTRQLWCSKRAMKLRQFTCATSFPTCMSPGSSSQ